MIESHGPNKVKVMSVMASGSHCLDRCYLWEDSQPVICTPSRRRMRAVRLGSSHGNSHNSLFDDAASVQVGKRLVAHMPYVSKYGTRTFPSMGADTEPPIWSWKSAPRTMHRSDVTAKCALAGCRREFKDARLQQRNARLQDMWVAQASRSARESR
jgi:hypothetical protein